LEIVKVSIRIGERIKVEAQKSKGIWIISGEEKGSERQKRSSE
jgi:hypothetical protein